MAAMLRINHVAALPMGENLFSVESAHGSRGGRAPHTLKKVEGESPDARMRPVGIFNTVALRHELVYFAASLNTDWR